MQPGCWLLARQPAGAGAVAAAAAGVGVRVGVGAVAGSSEYMQSTASVATLASISSIASTSASAMAALRARPYLVAPYVASAAASSAPPTPHPHGAAASLQQCSLSSAHTAPATPVHRQRRGGDGQQQLQEEIALAAMDEPPPLPQYCKPKSQRFFWRKALRRVFQRRK